MVLNLPHLFTREDALNAGFTRRDLARKMQERLIMRLAHGLYLDATTGIPAEHIDFVVAQYKFGKSAAIGGLTALFYHGLINQPPQQVWVIVPPEIRTKDRRYRLIRTQGRLDIGFETHGLFRICDINRTLAEAFKFASKVGLINAIGATTRAIKEKKTTFPEIMAMARELGYEKAVLKHWEALAGIGESA